MISQLRKLKLVCTVARLSPIELERRRRQDRQGYAPVPSACKGPPKDRSDCWSHNL